MNSILCSNRVSKTSLEEVEATHELFVNYFSSFHPNDFRNTITWKCFMKNDSVRSSLIELQSFLHSKIDVDPVYCVLTSLPCIMHDAVHSSRSYQNPCNSCPWVPQAERTLSVCCSNFDDGM